MPLAFAVTMPATALTGRSTGWLLTGSVAFTLALAALTRWLWRQALPRYSGASA